MNAFLLLCLFIAIAVSAASFNANSKWLSVNGGAAAPAKSTPVKAKATPVKKEDKTKSEAAKKAAQETKKKADAEAKKLADKVKAVSLFKILH